MNVPSVTTTAQKINELHQGLTKTMRLGIDTAIEIGQLLTDTKASLKHGEWGKWITDNLVFTDRTARNYMSLYESRERILGKDNLSGAYALLADTSENGNVSDLNKKKFQEQDLTKQVMTICRQTDSLRNKVSSTHTALSKLDGIESPTLAFLLMASFSSLLEAATYLLKDFGIDFIAEAQKPKEEPVKTAIAAPTKKDHAVDVEYEEATPKTTTFTAEVTTISDGEVRTIEVKQAKVKKKAPKEEDTWTYVFHGEKQDYLERVDKHIIRCKDCGNEYSYNDLRETEDGVLFDVRKPGDAIVCVCTCKMPPLKLNLVKGTDEKWEAQKAKNNSSYDDMVKVLNPAEES